MRWTIKSGQLRHWENLTNGPRAVANAVDVDKRLMDEAAYLTRVNKLTSQGSVYFKFVTDSVIALEAGSKNDLNSIARLV